ncbi:hypothetical protein LCGC14_1643800 [marine sediment metagenome]|uniref:Uncharacterized protein n=1 Tax=marine sediment metagenome TaxID=412755 RepID=A0A0F9HYT1_9ZZZZ
MPSKYDIKKSTIVSKPETTEQSIIRITSDIEAYKAKLEVTNAQIARIKAVECTEKEVKQLPQLELDALTNRVLIKGNEKLLDSFKARLREESVADLVEKHNQYTGDIETVLGELLSTFKAPLAMAIQLEKLWVERTKLHKKLDESCHGDSRVQQLPLRTTGVVSDVTSVGMAIVGIVKWYTRSYGSKYARNAIKVLDSPEALTKIVDDIEHQYFNEIKDQKRRAKEDAVVISRRLAAAAANAKLNTPTERPIKRDIEASELVSAKRPSTRAEKIEVAKNAKAKDKAAAEEYRAELEGVPVSGVPDDYKA